ncbi:MAG TPA: hypothetical protein VFT34_17460 [Verrucomicrobiae bacterium]|nr:hypothetical protein [Verrucomicrobiae bacterium]
MKSNPFATLTAAEPFTRLTAAERQEQRFEKLPRQLSNAIESGKIPADLLKQAGPQIHAALEAAIISLRGGGQRAEDWLKERMSEHGKPSYFESSALLGRFLAELQSGKSSTAAAAPASPAATIPMRPSSSPAAAVTAANSNVPLAETFLALDGPDDGEARYALWIAHEREFMNPDSVRAYGTNPTTRIDLIRAVFPWMPTANRTAFYRLHKSLLMD